MVNVKQKVLTIIMTSVLTLGAASIVNADTFQTRFSAKSNADTAILVSKAGWTQSDTVVIASSINFPDALCAVPLAKKYNAPILLTVSDDLSNETLDEIVRLNAKKAIIIGGTASVSKQAELELEAAKVTDIQRFGGADRYETSMLVAKQLDKPTAAVVAYGENFPDALSISAIAAQQGMPIILSSKNGLSSEAASYISSNGIKKTYIVGGTGVLSSSLESQLPNPTRLAGQDRYETNLAILKNFTSSLNLRKLYIATGNDFAGALIASPLAAKTHSPVILVDSD